MLGGVFRMELKVKSGIKFICPLCWNLCPVKNSKKDKPYYICVPCGVQVFIRGKDGISRLADLSTDKELLSKINSKNFGDFQKLFQLKSKIEFLKDKIDELEEDSFFKLFDNDKETTLKSKLKGLQDDYFTILSKL